MSKFQKILLSVLSGFIMAMAWPGIGGFSPLLLLGFVPLLFVEDAIFRSQKGNAYGMAFLSFAVFNAFIVYWSYMVTEGIETKLSVYLFAVLLNSTLMALTFNFFHYTRKKVGSKQGYIGLVLYWVAFEYFHLNWELAWPWFMLGSGFANTVQWVQWYEFTGVLGGATWIILSNIIIYKILDKAIMHHAPIRENRFNIISLILVLVVPIIISKYMYSNYKEVHNPVVITILQPNVDPYLEKYELPFSEQLSSMLSLATAGQLASSDYLIAPETALIEDIWENDLDRSKTIRRIKTMIEEYPQLNFVSGLTSYYLFDKEEEPSGTARQFNNSNRWYDVYNSAIQINSTANIEFYHKTKLVQGVEKMPFAALLKPFENMVLDMGGTSGSLGSQEEPEVFVSHDGKIKIAPVICYESIYGEYVSEYVIKGAQLIFIITNDGWWGDGAGYKQHLAHARLRAIETRRSIARSANTGISCFINQRGDYIEISDWWKPQALHATINTNDTLTFYTRHGDYLGRIASFTAIILLLYAVAKSIYDRKKILITQ